MTVLAGFSISDRSEKKALREEIEPKDILSEIQGTWVLVMEKYGEEGMLRPPQRGHVKQKLVNGKHFSWVEYTEEGEMVAMGGGTYEITGSAYTETIEYCYPTESNLLGVSIPFSHSFEDGMWLHKGFLRSRELNGDTGEYEVRETQRISEVWKKVSK